jgi:hypothetical protein
MATAILTVVCCIKGSNKGATALVPMIGAIVNIIGFNSVLILKLNAMWQVFVILSYIVLALAVIVFAWGIIKVIKKDRAILAERAAKAQ